MIILIIKYPVKIVDLSKIRFWINNKKIINLEFDELILFKVSISFQNELN